MRLFDLLPFGAVLLGSFNLLIFHDIVSVVLNALAVFGGIVLIVIRMREGWR